MNLVIDIGNTNAKYAVFKGGELINASVFSDRSIEQLKHYISQYSQIKAAIFCSVSGNDKTIADFLRQQYKCFIEFTNQTAIPLKIYYKTLETLGSDRLAAAIGAVNLFPEKNILVVNMGSCITYEIITEKGEYMGGKISPGAQMRLKALHQFTAKLPLLELTAIDNEVGQSTSESILSGVIKGIIYEIEGTIDTISKSYDKLQIVVSGGDAGFFAKAIKKPIFVEPFLVLKGLNAVLNKAS